MPTLWAHSHFWAGSGNVVIPPDPPLGSSAGGGYVPWQTSVITAMSLMLICRVHLQPCR